MSSCSLEQIAVFDTLLDGIGLTEKKRAACYNLLYLRDLLPAYLKAQSKFVPSYCDLIITHNNRKIQVHYEHKNVYHVILYKLTTVKGYRNDVFVKEPHWLFTKAEYPEINNPSLQSNTYLFDQKLSEIKTLIKIWMHDNETRETTTYFDEILNGLPLTQIQRKVCYNLLYLKNWLSAYPQVAIEFDATHCNLKITDDNRQILILYCQHDKVYHVDLHELKAVEGEKPQWYFTETKYFKVDEPSNFEESNIVVFDAELCNLKHFIRQWMRNESTQSD